MFPGILWVPLALYSSLLNSYILTYPLKKWQLQKAKSPETKMNFRCRSNKFIGPMVLLPISHRDQCAQCSLYEAPTLKEIPDPVSTTFFVQGRAALHSVPSKSPASSTARKPGPWKGHHMPPLRLMVESLSNIPQRPCMSLQ